MKCIKYPLNLTVLLVKRPLCFPADVQDQPADRGVRRREPQQLRGAHRHHHQRPQPAAALGAAGVLGHGAGEHRTGRQDSREYQDVTVLCDSESYICVIHAQQLVWLKRMNKVKLLCCCWRCWIRRE